jgi:hypothetical protein
MGRNRHADQPVIARTTQRQRAAVTLPSPRLRGEGNATHADVSASAAWGSSIP